MSPRERLTGALISLASQGRRPPCAEFGAAELWTSDDPEDRALAARWCRPCPIITPCLEAAVEEAETWTVRGGRDFRPAPKPRSTRQGDLA